MIAGKDTRARFRDILFADNMTRKPDKTKDVEEKITDPVKHSSAPAPRLPSPLEKPEHYSILLLNFHNNEPTSTFKPTMSS